MYYAMLYTICGVASSWVLRVEVTSLDSDGQLLISYIPI